MELGLTCTPFGHASVSLFSGSYQMLSYFVLLSLLLTIIGSHASVKEESLFFLNGILVIVWFLFFLLFLDAEASALGAGSLRFESRPS